jgi:hypothetical protein
MKCCNIGINDFVKRQTKESKYAHFTGTFEELIDIVKKSIEMGTFERGYRDGVVVVAVPPQGFFSSIRKLEIGDCLSVTSDVRREGESPYIQVNALGEKTQAEKVEVILYSKEVLAEGKENSTDCDYEIVSINAYPDKDESPMAPSTIARNVLCFKGGTDPKLQDKTKEELIDFINNMAKSVEYWGSRAMVVPKK